MANFQAQAPMNGRSKVAVRAAILGKAEFGVSRVCLFYWMRRARGELRLVSGRVRRTLPAPRNARLVLEIHENSAIVVLEDSCDILHKSSVSPSWRRTSPLTCTQSMERRSQCRDFVCPNTHVVVASSDWRRC